jgi:predicted RNA-binding Zn-ribbon protein involved in translation (DUF1610 family)
MNGPIAYTFEADTHCPACTVERFGTEPGRSWPTDDAEDSEGNRLGVIFPWDEWCEPSAPGLQVLGCGTCGGTIEKHEHEPEARCPACGDPIDYCQGHGEIGDPDGWAILQAHDSDDHGSCNAWGCDAAADEGTER